MQDILECVFAERIYKCNVVMLFLSQAIYRQLIGRLMHEFKIVWKELLWPNLAYYSHMFLQDGRKKT
jgi:uncharacterized membrane protein